MIEPEVVGGSIKEGLQSGKLNFEGYQFIRGLLRKYLVITS